MNFFRSWKSISWFVFILLFTFLPAPGGSKIVLFNHADKLVHLCLFMVFSVFLAADARRFLQASTVDKRVALIAILTGIITGLLTEIVQYYVIATRSGSVFDFIADIIGTLVGLTLYMLVAGKFRS